MTEVESSKKSRLDQKKLVSTRLSETTRIVSFGLVAFVYALQTSESDWATAYLGNFEMYLNFAGLFGILAITCDYFQYLCAYWSVQDALKRVEDDFRYRLDHVGYRLQNWFFFSKQLAAGIGTILILATFAIQVLFYV